MKVKIQDFEDEIKLGEFIDWLMVKENFLWTKMSKIIFQENEVFQSDGTCGQVNLL